MLLQQQEDDHRVSLALWNVLRRIILEVIEAKELVVQI
jgi:hypothetical protein